MQLIRNGEIVTDEFVALPDDASVPADGAIIVPAPRFLADPDMSSQRPAPFGVAWPNNRRVAELSPYLERLALVALNFPSFRDGRAYSQARQLREQHRFAGELRATGDVLRDQFLFMLRAGFDSLEVRKDADAAAFLKVMAHSSIYYQPASDHRATAAVTRLARAANGIETRAVGRFPRDLPGLNAALEHATPEEILAQAIRVAPRLAIVSSFGIESAVLLHLAASVDRSLPVIFLDTGWLFGETLAYRDSLIEQLGLTDVRTIRPDARRLSRADPDSELWSEDPDRCCQVRKVEPLADALASFDGWVTGRKRFQGGARTQLATVETDAGRLKFNPFAATPAKEIAARFGAANLPRHPLAASGYLSVGCLPCSSRARAGEGVRDGRWRGRGRTECGIHGF
ncbi:MAG TPA: phosphoadenylyl-sulfate reductase [Rhizomicrobium sp.]|jgi:phosphoadenosine phosphosulfate reductase|nr:phosphoadenylyl-sulfate reductase [Rhizomicrobium sp.]